MARQKLTVEAEAKGFEGAAQKVKGLAEAQGQVVAAGKTSTEATEGAAEAQDNLNVAADTYVGLAARMSPVYGIYADTLIRLRRVALNFMNTQFSLGDVVTGSTKAIKRNFQALKMFAAGGAAVGGIWLVVRAVQALKTANEEAQKEIAKQTAELNEQLEKTRELEKAYTAAANARKKYLAIGQAKAAPGTGRARRIAEKYGIDEGIATQIAGELEGVQIDFETQAAYTAMRAAGRPGVGELGQYASGAARQRAVERTVQRDADWWRSRQAAIAEDRRREEQEVLGQAASTMGRTGALAKFIKTRIPDLSEEDLAELVKQVQQFGGSREALTGEEGRAWSPLSWARGERLRRTQDPGWFGRREYVSLEPREYDRLERILTALEAIQRRDAVEPRTVVNHVGARIFDSSASHRRAARTNGQSRYGVGATQG